MVRGALALLHLSFIESAYPDGLIWELNTPDWAVRNRRFYDIKVDEVRLENIPLTVFYCQKSIG